MSYYICSCSFGKDSMASVLLALIHGEPLDEVVYSEVMFDSDTSGEVPEHREFIYNVAIPFIEARGIKVTVLRANKTYVDCFYHIRGERSKYCGKLQGFPLGGKCIINGRCKIPPIEQYMRKLKKQHGEIVQYVGIALDEPKRLARLKDGKISLLAKYGYTEADAFDIDRTHGLLSPIYDWTSRNGCWFCPSAKVSEMAHIKEHHPHLWERLRELDRQPNRVREAFAWGETFAQVDAKVSRYIARPKQIKPDIDKGEI